MGFATTTFDASGLYSTEAKPAPLARFFAKNIDLGVFVVGVYIFIGLLGLIPPESEAFFWAPFIGLIVFPFFESASQFLLGNTLGKKLLGVRVSDENGSGAAFSKLLQRNYRCYVQGLGLGVPVVSLVTHALGFISYTRSGGTKWDREAGTSCETQNAALWRSLLIGLAPLWLSLVLIVIMSAMQPSMNSSYDAVERGLRAYE